MKHDVPATDVLQAFNLATGVRWRDGMVRTPGDIGWVAEGFWLCADYARGLSHRSRVLRRSG